MIISDLNYLEAVQTEAIGGYNFGDSSYTKVSLKFKIDSNVKSNLHVYGNFAGSEADATASGYNTYTNTVTATDVSQGYGSASTSTSVSATTGSYYYP
jgi:hypothetical protein